MRVRLVRISGWRNVWKKVTCFIPQAGQSSMRTSSMWMLLILLVVRYDPEAALSLVDVCNELIS